MRKIQTFDILNLKNGQLALLTLKSIKPTEIFHIADFNDIQAPVFTKTGSYFGWSSESTIKLGRGPAELINGIWVIEEDEKAIKSNENLTIDPNLVEMKMIK